MTEHLTEHLFELTDAGPNGQSLRPRSARAGDPQWRLESLQMVNWGGFEGHHTITYHPDATLVSGGSGTGKSTMLDAYTALLMPSSVPFNGASNDAGAGRARDEAGGQRTLLTYLRGKVGNTDEGGGNKSAKLLRGKGRATWGAVAGTFLNTDGETFTAARVYYLPASAHDVSGISEQRLTYEGRLDLADIAAAMLTYTPSGQQLGKVLTGAVAGTRRHDTYAAFANTLFTKLAIGANGDGDHALQLLARIQASKSFKSVNEQYRRLVLDTPATFADADRALRHFDSLDDSYRQMETAANKAAVLRDIATINARLMRARTEMGALDTFGLTRPGHRGPVTTWARQAERELLDRAVDELVSLKQTVHAALRVAAEDVVATKGRLAQARVEYDKHGGASLESLGERIAADEAVRDERESTRSRLVGSTEVLDPDLSSRASFETLLADGVRFLADADAAEERHTRARDDALAHDFKLRGRKDELISDLTSFRSRAGRIDPRLDSLRREVAAASGFNVEELPFLAELIDVADGQDRWRLAVETVLGGDARRLLVPPGRLDDFSAAINRLQLRGRITFVESEADVALRYPLSGATDSADRARVVGKLQFADHRYAGWIQRRLSSGTRNALCVESPRDLAGAEAKVTLTGQTRHGVEGAHGRGRNEFVIGFSNASLVEQYEAELLDVEAQLQQSKADLGAISDAAMRHRLTREAHVRLAEYRWEQLDVDAMTVRIADMTAQRERVLAASDKLAELDAQIRTLEVAHDEHVGRRTVLEQDRDRLEKQHGDLVDRQDLVADDLDKLLREPAAALDDAQAARLAAAFAAAAAPGDPANLDHFEVHLGKMHQSLVAAAEAARTEAARSEGDLAKVFTQYKATWDDPNLGVGVDSYPDYQRILDEIDANGLTSAQEKWKAALMEWSGEDLVPLATSIRTAVAEIEDRIAPINDILAGLPFGSRGGHLKIKVTRLHLEPVRRFLIRLKKLSATATEDLDFDAAQRRFRELTEFMHLLRHPRDPRFDKDRSDRDRLLDVNRHVEISALELPARPGDFEPREYTMLGETSGGETQELVAFIIGSALRFRLGDQLRDRPRFAPVFLDEGFVKADAQFAGRAVEAWKGLGFQIIVGTPEDKVTGLEVHMDLLLAITKDPQTNFSFVHAVVDRDRAHPDGAVARSAQAPVSRHTGHKPQGADAAPAGHAGTAGTGRGPVPVEARR